MYKHVLPSWVKIGGGQLNLPLIFSNIRKQIWWGNRLITFENNYLFSKEWNNSEQLFVNNIIDKHDEIRQEFFLQKLKNKSNWISECSIAKQVFPNNWIEIL